MTIKFTIENIENIQLSDLRQVDGTQTLYKGMISGGTVSESTVTGGEITETPLVDADKNNFIKQYTVTAEYLSATEQQKAAVIGKSLTATVKAYGQAKLRNDQSLTGSDAESHSLTVTFTDASTISVTGNLYVRVQAKQTGDKTKVDTAADHSGDKVQVEAVSKEFE